MRKEKYRFCLIVLCILSILFLGAYGLHLNVKEKLIEHWSLENTEVDSASISNTQLYPGGMAAGIYLETDGVMILGTKELKAVDGKDYEPARRLVSSGDYIIEFNQHRISSKQDLIAAVSELDGSEVSMQIRRHNENHLVTMRPVETREGEYMLGIWVRDNTQGLGTVTYVTEDGEFGALGHGLKDGDTGELLTIANGHLYKTGIRSIKKGEQGTPGGMEGIIIYNHYNIIASINRNTEEGLFGTVEDRASFPFDETPLCPATKEEVKTGKATIRCQVEGTVEEYEVAIRKVDAVSKEPSKGLTIQITDKKLLEVTGGIVQGMSGSPIIQNGKIVGAVTHVFVDDPTKGYGIFIENMLTK